MSVLRAKLEGNIRKVYILRALSGMFFSLPILVLFWQKNGLSLTEVMILQSCYAITTVALEIPSGYFADIYGRKKSLIFASIMGVFGMIFYGIGHSFLEFFIAESFFALSVSFTSGTLSAFVYDTLQNLGREQEYKKIWGKMIFYSMMAQAFSNMAGGFIATISFRFAIYASIPFFVLMIPVSISLYEPDRHKLIFKKGYTRELIDIVKNTVVHNKKLRWIIVYSGVIYAFNQVSLWLYQPYFELSGVGIAYFGIVFASFQLVAAYSSKHAHQLEEKLGKNYSLIMLTFLVSISYLLMSNFIFLFSFTFGFIQQFVRGFKNVVITDYINKLSKSNARATVLSMESFFGKLLYAIIIPIFGWVADIYSITQALTVIGVTALASGVVVLIILKKDEVITF